MKKVATIVCGSPFLTLPKTLEGYVVGADKGALRLLEAGFNVDVAIGDFDSVTPAEYQYIAEKAKHVVKLPVEKDVTDAEAAVVHVIDLGYTCVRLYGALGGRFDHQFGVVVLMLKYAKKGIEMTAVDEKNKVLILSPGYHQIQIEHTYFSLFALDQVVQNLTITGAKYPLAGYDLAVDDSMCVSNEAISDAVSIQFDAGYLLISMSSD